MALKLIAQMGLPTEGYRSKSWDEFAGPDAPQFDFIITVCDNAAGEVCPVWPGRPLTAHWGIEDPAAVEGPGQEQAFLAAMRYLAARINLMLALPIESLDQLALKRRLDTIGAAEGATALAKGTPERAA
jgi:arsenate reductase